MNDPRTMNHDELVLLVLELRQEAETQRERGDRLAAELALCEEHRRGLQGLADAVHQAINEGDGTYRP